MLKSIVPFIMEIIELGLLDGSGLGGLQVASKDKGLKHGIDHFVGLVGVWQVSVLLHSVFDEGLQHMVLQGSKLPDRL